MSKAKRSCRLNKLRILVADDHEIVRHGLLALIKGHLGWEVCAECENGTDAVGKAKTEAGCRHPRHWYACIERFRRCASNLARQSERQGPHFDNCRQRPSSA